MLGRRNHEQFLSTDDMQPPTLHKTSGKVAGQLGKPVYAKLCVTDKRNGAVELCLGSLLAGTVAAIENMTRAGLARYNSFREPYLSGKPAIDLIAHCGPAPSTFCLPR